MTNIYHMPLNKIEVEKAKVMLDQHPMFPDVLKPGDLKDEMLGIVQKALDAVKKEMFAELDAADGRVDGRIRLEMFKKVQVDKFAELDAADGRVDGRIRLGKPS